MLVILVTQTPVMGLYVWFSIMFSSAKVIELIRSNIASINAKLFFMSKSFFNRFETPFQDSLCPFDGLPGKKVRFLFRLFCVWLIVTEWAYFVKSKFYNCSKRPEISKLFFWIICEKNLTKT